MKNLFSALLKGIFKTKKYNKVKKSNKDLFETKKLDKFSTIVAKEYINNTPIAKRVESIKKINKQVQGLFLKDSKSMDLVKKRTEEKIKKSIQPQSLKKALELDNQSTEALKLKAKKILIKKGKDYIIPWNRIINNQKQKKLQWKNEIEKELGLQKTKQSAKQQVKLIKQKASFIKELRDEGKFVKEDQLDILLLKSGKLEPKLEKMLQTQIIKKNVFNEQVKKEDLVKKLVTGIEKLLTDITVIRSQEQGSNKDFKQKYNPFYSKFYNTEFINGLKLRDIDKMKVIQFSQFKQELLSQDIETLNENIAKLLEKEKEVKRYIDQLKNYNEQSIEGELKEIEQEIFEGKGLLYEIKKIIDFDDYSVLGDLKETDKRSKEQLRDASLRKIIKNTTKRFANIFDNTPPQDKAKVYQNIRAIAQRMIVELEMTVDSKGLDKFGNILTYFLKKLKKEIK